MGLIGATAFSTVVQEQWQVISATRKSVKLTCDGDYYMICSYELTQISLPVNVQTKKKVGQWYEKRKEGENKKQKKRNSVATSSYGAQHLVLQAAKETSF